MGQLTKRKPVIANKGLPVKSSPAESGGEAWHAISALKAAEFLQVDLNSGLTAAAASQRLEEVGPNQLREVEKEPFWKEFIEELREPLILLLVFTGILYIILGEVSDGITIFFVILTLNTIEVFNEQRARKAISALHKLAEPTALVIREGQALEISVEYIVPGDVILLQDGRRVPADARLSESFGLAIDESSLTGESVPIDKDANLIEDTGIPLAERVNLVYSGSLITRGRGKAIVFGTGMATELGRIAGMAREIKEPRTPLQKAMDEVSKSLLWLALIFSIAIPVLGVLIARQPIQTMLLTGLSLAFATIPEEMPIIITMVLSLGAYRLSKQNAIVKHLNAVETLGAVTVIATDKTGTLTENRMQVGELFPAGNQQRILTAGFLCNDAIVDGVQMKGDPLEIALAQAGQKFGLNGKGLASDNPRMMEFSFENVRKRMSVVTQWNAPQADSSYRIWVKGAPESILPISTRQETDSGTLSIDGQARQILLEKAAQMAELGYRVIAFAEKNCSTIPTSQEEAESGLTFLGLAGLLDPPRVEVREAIRVMQGAGIRSLMITGDHPLTAKAVARAVGLTGEERIVSGTELDHLSDAELRAVVSKVSLYARTTPEHKLRIVQALQAQGERVAVTGDGVNDAPALTMADIGVAMGETGSDVAREAGDVVLADDNYATIANAVREGRALFANLKKGVRYYLAIKVALVSVMLLPILLQVPVPFVPVQIILMELFMDLAAAAAFVAEPAEGDLMRLPPRNPKARFMDREMIVSILVSASGLFAAVSAAYLLTWYRGADQIVAQTVAFAAWMVGHVLLAFNMRSERQPILQLGLGSNRLMLAWGGAVALFLILISLIPGAQHLMKITTLSAALWGMILIITVIGTFWIGVRKLITYRAFPNPGARRRSLRL